MTNSTRLPTAVARFQSKHGFPALANLQTPCALLQYLSNHLESDMNLNYFEAMRLFGYARVSTSQQSTANW